MISKINSDGGNIPAPRHPNLHCWCVCTDLLLAIARALSGKGCFQTKVISRN